MGLEAHAAVTNGSARPSERCIAAALSVVSTIAPFRQSLWNGVLEENTLEQACTGRWCLAPCASRRTRMQEGGMVLQGRRPSGAASVGRCDRRAGQAEPELQGRALRPRHTLLNEQRGVYLAWDWLVRWPRIERLA
jgi:hypothetical protein